MSKISNREELLAKLCAYAENPDDDNIRIKEEIKKVLMRSPELLYAIHNGELEPELFNENDTINMDEETGELLGEVDRYFGENSNIRPFLYIPETQTNVKNYLCYQTSYDEFANRYNNKEKHMIVTFVIFVNGRDAIDKQTGIPRHDLIASILREKFAWIGLEISTPVPFSDKESLSDNNYIVRTLQYQITLPNSICTTEKSSYNNEPFARYSNKMWRDQC